MTENLKAFLEAVSGDKAFLEKLTGTETPEAVIALAKERGFTLTAEDVQPEPASGALSDDELDAVAGGNVCICPLAGVGGTQNSAEDYDKKRISELTSKDNSCICFAAGAGTYMDGSIRCACPVIGGGATGDETKFE